MGKICLRPAVESDCELLWQWANAGEVRQNSFNMEQIPLKKHTEWFKMVLANADIKLYILQENDFSIGQVRLAYDTNAWQISYSIAPAYRGQGYGKIILQLAENELIRSSHVGEQLYAEVKKHNIASRRIFKNLGYDEAASKQENAYGYMKVVAEKIYDIATPVSTRRGTILLLSNNTNSLPLLEWLEKRVDVLYYSDILNVAMFERIKPHLVISYNYRHIIKPDIINAVQGKIINLHISLLPWNRGSAPNIWSFIDDTPKGVTIHILDEGFDTGDILLQKEIFFEEETETLKSSYERLNIAIVQLLQDNWSYIYGRVWKPQKQAEGGSIHSMNDLQRFLNERTISYDMTIAQFRRIVGGSKDYDYRR